MITPQGKIKFWYFFAGLVIGIGLGVCVFSYLVPTGLDMIKLYHLDNGQMTNGNLLIKSKQ